jgi:hypothetical protein
MREEALSVWKTTKLPGKCSEQASHGRAVRSCAQRSSEDGHEARTQTVLHMEPGQHPIDMRRVRSLAAFGELAAKPPI